MKVAVCLALLCVVVYGEFCSQDSDCHLTSCGSNFRADCFNRDGSHVCTCVPTDNDGNDKNDRCSTMAECQRTHGYCNHADHVWHCIDGQCRCGHGQGNGHNN